MDAFRERLKNAIMENILSKISLRGLAEEAGAVFAGDSSACPLHGGGDPQAFQLYEDGQKWRCPTCSPPGKEGSLFTFYMRWKGVDGDTAIRALSERAGLPLGPPPAPRQHWQLRASRFVEEAHGRLLDPQAGAPARDYLEGACGLLPETWKAFKLGYHPTGRREPAGSWGLEGDRQIWLPRGIVIPAIESYWPASIKIMRLLPGDALSEYLDPPPIPSDPQSLVAGPKSRVPKFSRPRGSTSALFGAHLWTGFQVLLLAAGEWDTMLAWQAAAGLCDVGSVCGPHRRSVPIDLDRAVCYVLVLSLTGGDACVDWSLRHATALARVVFVDPPAPSLGEFARSGGDLRRWIASQVAGHYGACLDDWQGMAHPAWVERLEEARRAAI